MTHQTAKFILHREGLDVFSLSELRGLLVDRFNPLPDSVRQAIQTLFTQKGGNTYAFSNRGFKGF